MAKSLIAKAGWTITVTSWENDGDYGSTESHTVTEKRHAEFFVKLANSLGGDSEYGNMYEPYEEQKDGLNQAIMELVTSCGVEDLLPGREAWHDSDSEQLYGLLDFIGLSGTDFYTRYMQSVTVTYSPGDIFVEDVTEDFT
jgi:hypothetical protein